MKILVGMSGGVDSSVAACLLQRDGHEVIGATMAIWDEPTRMDGKSGCFAQSAAKVCDDAEKVCRHLGIPYHVIDCATEYRKLVLDNFKREYLNGRTPNPCIICNQTIKFMALPNAARAKGLEFDRFASGHYAVISYDQATMRYQLRTAADKKKDQSYFLYRLSQEQLAGIMFPLGGYAKPVIRAMAKEMGLPVFDKQDSQDFYSGPVSDIIGCPPQKGEFTDKNGNVLGHHDGIWNFTVGQRKGLGIAAPRPLYVIGLDVVNNRVILGHEEEAMRRRLTACDMAWLSIPGITAPIKAAVKVRSAQTPIDAVISPQADGKTTVDFIQPQKSLAPGQSAVFYQDDLVLGGGIIESAE